MPIYGHVYVEQEPNEIEKNGLHQRIPSVILHYPTKFGDSSSNIKHSVAFRWNWYIKSWYNALYLRMNFYDLLRHEKAISSYGFQYVYMGIFAY